MKKRILSSILALLMLATSIIAVFPLSASAEEAGVTVNVTAPDAALKANKLLESYKGGKGEYKFDTAEQMLKYELENGYLDSVSAGEYNLYVNKYIGTVYYQNVVTGQVLVSNPYDHNATGLVVDEDICSQIEIAYAKLSDSASSGTYYSSSWIAKDFPISVKAIENGLSVTYDLGYRVDDLLAPTAIMRDDFDKYFAEPMFDKLAAYMEENFGPLSGTLKTRYGDLTSYDLAECSSDVLRRNGCYDKARVEAATKAFLSYAKEKVDDTDQLYSRLNNMITFVNVFFNNYNMYSVLSLKNDEGEFSSPEKEADFKLWCETIPALADEENAAAYLIDGETVIDIYLVVSNAVKAVLGNSITAEIIEEIDDNARCEITVADTPWFSCSVEYTLDESGVLYVNLPTDSITYNDEYYSISSISVIKYFGSGDVSLEGKVTDGYAFMPDGSGAVVEFKDITNINASSGAKVYGQDSCYSYIDTGKPTEQVTMPVYGIVTYNKASETTKQLYGVDYVHNGFFTVIESGATMSTIAFSSDMRDNKAWIYNSYSPYPMDRYDLSQTLSVGGTSFYNMMAKTHYEGDCKTRVTMLTDSKLATLPALSGRYPSTYVGMANCYKDYLVSKGVIGDLIEASDDLPLYIEALGSIDVVEKILTFPVTVSIPLTEFEDIEQMYEDFINAKDKLIELADEEREAAQELLDSENASGDVQAQAQVHIRKAEKYEALSTQIDNIINVNFKLTGFANGGMHFTYPAKLKWERSVGGKKGFKALVDKAAEYSKKDGYTFGVYPDFDFLYISNTAAFDGIGLNRSAARLVDNRYASKQTWNPFLKVNGGFEITYKMLVTANELDRLFDKFDKKYSKYENNALSVSTLGSDLNSNFDEDNLINREESLVYVKALLNKMSNERNYSLMTDKGNVYSVEYVDHILNATIDSSHLKDFSYTVPFYGLVLHGYVNYAGSPINYSGMPDYEILRAIENGASLYYVLCTQNTNKLKEDPELSKYYGIDYHNWYERMLVQNKTLNDAIGELQTYEITDHKKVIAERVIDSDETMRNFERLVAEFMNDKVNSYLRALLDETLAAIRGDAGYADLVGAPIYIYIDKAELVSFAVKQINLDEEQLAHFDFDAMFDAIAAEYVAEGYNVSFGTTTETALNYITFSSEDILERDGGKYASKYDYVTDSFAEDEDYDKTDFTCDNGNVVKVTYTDRATGDTVVFFLNYNTFAVDITVATGEIYRASGLGFVKLPADTNN